MRKLTLVRKKSFVGCACRVFVYRTLSAGEPTYDLLLNGVPCLLVTTLKNGKQTEIEIPDCDRTVWVSNSRMLPNDFKEGYLYPAGAEAGTLYIKMRFSPFEGNPIVLSTTPN